MKKRNGFVSNSSSSSFICDVSGETASGWDMCLSEAGMYECSYGHVFEESYLVGEIDRKQFLIDSLESNIKSNSKRTDSYYTNRVIEDSKELEKIETGEYDEDEIYELAEDYELRYSLPKENCPICSMKYFKDEELINYFLKKNNTNLSDISKEISEKFSDYEDFRKYI